LLRKGVTLKYRSISRLFLQAYLKVCTFLRWQAKFKIPSSAAFGQIGQAYVKLVMKAVGEWLHRGVYFEFLESA
jgi:hypothetical protein